MYKLEGVLSEKFVQGQVIRMKKAFKQELNTAVGVTKFIEEQAPFSKLTIKDISGKDVTKRFTEKQ